MTSKAFSDGFRSLVLAVSVCLIPAAHAQIFNDAQSELRVQWMQMKRDLPRHPNPAVQRYAQCVAWAIIDVIPEEFHDLDWEVIVFDSPEKNASVTPEGKIAVFSGILEVANTPDKLAAVLGHEVSHLTQGHVKSRVLRAAGTGLLGVVGGAVTGFGGESQSVAQVLMQLPYQREQETEADLVGMGYMAKAGYNPSAVLELWGDMAGDRKGRPPEWLSTHPDPEFRRSDMARNLAPALVTYNKALDAGVRPRCHL
jgi:predicted Zn-dependent protease